MKLKKFLGAIMSISLIFAIMLSNETLAKYFVHLNGLVWVSNYTDSLKVGNSFVIETIEPSKSESVWGGATTEDGKLESPNSDYTMGKLDEVEMSVYNNTDVPMLISFEITCYIIDDSWLSAINTFNIYIVNTYVYDEYVSPGDNVNGATTEEKLNFSVVRNENEKTDSNVYFEKLTGDEADSYTQIGGLLTYHRRRGFIKPNEISTLSNVDLLENFVVEPGEMFKYHMRVYFDERILIGGSGDSWWSTYATIKLISEPYTG